MHARIDEYDHPAVAAEHHRNARRPDLHPFAVSQRGLHTITCPAVTQTIPDTYATPTGDAHAQGLRAYAHTRIDERHPEPVPFRPLSAPRPTPG